MDENGFGERPNERYAQCCVNERILYGGRGVMVREGISIKAPTDLVIMERGKITAPRYITDC